MNGVIAGGWGFVWAAYAVSILVLGGYALLAIRAMVRAVTRDR
jgi:heme exporter protein D